MNSLRPHPLVAMVTHEEDEFATAAYWSSKTPAERLAALAILVAQKHPITGDAPRKIEKICRVVSVPWILSGDKALTEVGSSLDVTKDPIV